MGIIRQKFDFDSMVVSEVSLSQLGDVVLDEDGSEYSELDFYKDIVLHNLTFQCPEGFDGLEKRVFERYGEDFVKKYLEVDGSCR